MRQAKWEIMIELMILHRTVRRLGLLGSGLLIWFAHLSLAAAQSVTLVWDANTESDSGLHCVLRDGNR